MAALKLRFASGPYDRLDALKDGTVTPEGIELENITLWPPRQIFDRMAGEQAYDVAEFSCSELICLVDRGDCPFVALPVFPSRVFRHGFICVNAQSGIRSPRELEGKRIGVPLYTQTAAIWIRGLLKNDYGVNLDSIRWIEGAVMQSGSHGDPAASPMRRPPVIENNETGRPLADLLIDRKLDAILGTFVDDAVRAHRDIVRLFHDYRSAERDYFQRTGIFPMMHLVVIRKDVYEANPWIAGALYGAFDTAKDAALAALGNANTQRYALPWLLADTEEIAEVFGGDPWVNGIEPNRRALETLIGYMHQQGFIERKIGVDELFVPVE
tara:strand:+ start:124 stop:1101 length:978 start_codon:yes stop_codon:yes gene_type:complete